MGADFMARIADGFRAIAAAEPDRCAIINANTGQDIVFATIRAALRAKLNLP
jgi:dTMP kinase